ncbi:MAG: glycosyltransferase [Planctomycetota bacterium]
MRLTVILPFFNEEALLPDLPATLDAIRAALSKHDVEILAVDDGSTDKTADGLAALDGVRVETHPENRGVGAAMNTGLNMAEGEAAIVFDADAPYPPETLAELVDALEHADVSTLSPYHPDGEVEGVGAFRLLLSKGASMLYRRKLKSDLHTFTCAVRAYRLPQAKALLPAPDDFTAAAYLMARALQTGLRVVEVPAVLRARAAGSSKMRVGSTIRSHLRLLARL